MTPPESLLDPLRGAARRTVVVGAGTAGHRVAAQLAAGGGAEGGSEITVLGEEQCSPYNRVLLAEVLAGRYTPEVAALPSLAGPIVLRRGVRAVRIDREQRRVLCDDGSVERYDDLVLATGSNPVLPPLRGLFDDSRTGAERHRLPDGVHAFRTMDDCAALDALLRAGGGGTRAVVVGGGLLGVSAARALAARGVPTVLAHQGEHLMERQLDPASAALLAAHLESLGVEIHTECRVRSIRTSAAGRSVTGVELADGYRLDVDLLVLACGVRPRVGLAAAAGLAVRRGVVVDDRLRTDDPRIRAVGDCAEHRGVSYGLAGPALEQADLLARMLAEPERAAEPEPERQAGVLRYGGSRLLTRLTLPGTPGLDLAAFGDPGEVKPDDHVLQLADGTRRAYRKLVVRDDRLVGGILLGDLATVGDLAQAWSADTVLDAPPLHLLTTHGGHS